jgi:hypothetical protein
LRFFTKYLLGHSDTVTERSLTKEVRDVLKAAITTARNQGRTNVLYEDYPTFENGLTAQELVAGTDPEKRKALYPRNLIGAARLLWDSMDPKFAAASTFGRFQFRVDRSGNAVLEDHYDFSKATKERPDAYSFIRNLIGPERTGFAVKAKLGKLTFGESNLTGGGAAADTLNVTPPGESATVSEVAETIFDRAAGKEPSFGPGERKPEQQKGAGGVVFDHAQVALRHIALAIKQAMGIDVKDEDITPITEKTVSPEVLTSIKKAAFKAFKGNRGTRYADFGNARKLVFGNERGDTLDILKNMAGSFLDPDTAAGLTIGESSDVFVDQRGHLIIANDEYNFIEIDDPKQGDLWLKIQGAFSDRTGIVGSSKKHIPIRFDLGPVKDVEKLVRSRKNK